MPYRFAIVGCGNISERHAAAIRKAGILSGVCDPDLSRAQSLATIHETRAFSGIPEMISAVRPDIVSVCSPSGMHPEHARIALEAGCHVVCEKPLSVDLSSAYRVLESAKAAGKKLFVVKQNRQNPHVMAVRKLIDLGKLGNLYAFHVNCLWNRNEEYFRIAPWRGQKSVAGGTLYTQFSHFIDLVYWFFGHMREVSGWRGNFCHTAQIDFEDYGTANFIMENGAIGSMVYSINADRNNQEGSIAIFGSEGSVKIGGTYLNQIDYFNVQHESLENWLPPVLEGASTGHTAVYESVVSSLEGSPSDAMEGSEALRSLEMIEQIYHASPMIT